MTDQSKTTDWVGPQDALGELQRRTAMLDAIGYAATRIVLGADWRVGIQELLNRLGVAAEASRVSLFEIHRDAKGMPVESCRYDWTEPGQPPMSTDPRYQNMPLIDADGVIDDWTRRRQRGEVVQALQRDLTGYTRQVFEETATLSFISVPIMLRSGCWGFLAFDDCHVERSWTALEVDVLKTAASLIAGAMERAQADERLRLSEERYALAARGASDGLWDWDVVTERAYFSPRLHEILGLQDGALGDSMATFLDCFHAEDAARIRDYIRARFAARRRKLRFEARLRESADHPRWFVARAMIVYDGERPTRVVGSMRDITEVKEADAKLRTLTDDAPVLLSMIDPDDRLIFANSRFLKFFGRTLEDIAAGGWDWTGDIHPDDLPEVQRRWSEALRLHHSVEFEHRVRRHDGEYRWVHESEVARFSPEGQFLGFVGALVDITDRKRAEAQLSDSERRRAVLARHFSPNMVEELMRTGGQLDAVRTQPIAVMFADLFGFTVLSATMPATDVVGLLRSFHALVEEAVFGNQGTLDKYIGDGVLATFGTPRPGPRDATNAVGAARAIIAGINRWNSERAEHGRRPIRIGIGLHYGEATLGNVGSARRFEHTVVGETVNLASRIENLTRELDIALLVSGAIIEAVKREGGDAVL
ncbi:MAG TPA: PAS domain S-box protein, partial [Candidatus Acidoferrum sp.]|nr:PAS domain S-box protein [Candidatus Acidoferrum sp.]